jgi:hypothetical protein
MAVSQSWMTVENFNLQDLEEKYKLPIFAGLWICLTGFKDCKSCARGGLVRGSARASEGPGSAMEGPSCADVLGQCC